MGEIGVVKVHVFVNVGQAQLLSTSPSRRRHWGMGATKDVTKSSEPMLEEPAMSGLA